MKRNLLLSLLATTTLVHTTPVLQTHNNGFLKETTGFEFKKHTFNKHSAAVNNRPMIGVLTQPLTDTYKKDPRFHGKTSFIAAAYI